MAPDHGEPPAASTPMKANWEPPVKVRTERAQVCRTDSPDVTPSAPKEMPYAPTATPTPRESVSTVRRVSCQGVTRGLCRTGQAGSRGSSPGPTWSPSHSTNGRIARQSLRTRVSASRVAIHSAGG